MSEYTPGLLDVPAVVLEKLHEAADIAVPLVHNSGTIAVAVGAAIAGMMSARAVHPPAGGTAIIMATSVSPIILDLGYVALLPIGMSAAAMVGTAVVLNTAAGRKYPL